MKHSRRAISMLIAKYRAVIQKTWWKNLRTYDVALFRCKKGVFAAGLIISLAISPGLAAAGETFTYIGNPTDPHLRTIDGNPNSLAPIDSSNPIFNNITINYTSSDDTKNPNWVYGGYSNSDTVTDNAVNMINGTVQRHIFGGYSNRGAVNNNTVTISGGAVQGDIYGGYSYSGTANNNAVNVSGTTGSGYIYGGNSYSGSANSNTVTISGGTVLYSIYGGYSSSGAANSNAVAISGGTVQHNIFGGCSSFGSANNNTVTISGGTVQGYIYGGYSSFGTADSNTVNIFGSPNLTSAVLWGSNLSGSIGNTLNITGYQGSVGGINNFQYYNFYLPASVANGSTILAITDSTPVNLTGASVAITGITPGGAPLHPGDTITLISKTQNAPLALFGNVYSRSLLQYKFNYVTSNTAALQVQFAGEQASPQAKAVSEGRITGIIAVNKGQDLVSGQAMTNIANSVTANNTPTAFSAMNGSAVRFQTGSHVDMNGFSFLVGVGKKNAAANGAAANGFFLEAGRGNFSSYNSFATAASINASGETNYGGVGFLARRQNNDGRYIEGSARAGSASTNFRSGDLSAASGQNTDFSVSAPYYGMHIGIGKEKSVGQNLSLDTYTRFLWSHQNAATATVAGADVDFAAVNSYRWQVGMKLSHKINERTTVRTGLAYQYEFGGDANASTLGHDIDAPSLKGSSVIGELGMTIEPQNAKAPFLNLSLQGFAGKCTGVAGSVEVAWKF